MSGRIGRQMRSACPDVVQNTPTVTYWQQRRAWDREVKEALEGTTPALTVKSGNYAVTTDDAILVASNGAGPLTFTLPASPEDGQRIAIANHNGVHALTVARNGQLINNVAADLTIAADGAATLYFVATRGWYQF